MIDDVDRQIARWIEGVLADTRISRMSPANMPPADMKDTTVIGVYLKDILPSPSAHFGRRPPLEVLLYYLVTSWDRSPERANRRLLRLVFAAMEHELWEIELKPLPAGDWRAFGLAPRPSFLLRLPLRFERSDETAPVIRSPVEVRKVPVTPE